jgi:predicted 2-oxoglutarate/Fe(II)-dependent dioxygenase YbiX/peroxiredoxin
MAEPYVRLLPGDPAPWFHQSCGGNPRYSFDSVGGRYVVFCFFASASDERAKAALETLSANRERFDDVKACFFGVSVDPGDQQHARVKDELPGIRYFWDFDVRVSKLYGAAPKDAVQGNVAIRQFFLVLDPMLRVMASFPIDQGDAAFAYLKGLPNPERHVGYEVQAPILILPRVFEPEFCRRLIDAYEAAGGEESGFMREVGGKTVEVRDSNFKVRRDYFVEDQDTVKQVQARITRRVTPEIAKIYCVNCTRMERYLVGCYAQDEGGHFRPHRDNTTKGTAHRRFAVSINLNDDFDGGELSFPEFGPRSFKAPPGAALIFPGALLHAVSKVTRGKRYAFLPFVYDEAAAKIREENARFIEGEASNYKASGATATS